MENLNHAEPKTSRPFMSLRPSISDGLRVGIQAGGAGSAGGGWSARSGYPSKLSIAGSGNMAVWNRIRFASSSSQQEFEHSRKRYWGQRFWGRGYFSTTSGNITNDIICVIWTDIPARMASAPPHDPTGLGRSVIQTAHRCFMTQANPHVATTGSTRSSRSSFCQTCTSKIPTTMPARRPSP